MSVNDGDFALQVVSYVQIRRELQPADYSGDIA
jgi:hypothetical protein